MWFPQEGSGGGLVEGSDEREQPAGHPKALPWGLEPAAGPASSWGAGGALAHKSRGGPSGSRPATQKGACGATLLCVPKPHLLPRRCPCWHQTPTPTPCCSPRWEEGLALPRAPETGGRVVLSCHIQPTPTSGQPATTGEAVSPPEQPHWPRPSSGVRSHLSPQNKKDMLSIRGDFILVT